MTASQLLTTSFTTKEEYLLWRAAWRSVYAQLSADIRLSKQVHSDNARNHCNAPLRVECVRNEQEQARWTEYSGPAVERMRSVYNCGSWALSARAKALCERRVWSKVEAQRQYLARKAVAEPMPMK